MQSEELKAGIVSLDGPLKPNNMRRIFPALLKRGLLLFLITLTISCGSHEKDAQNPSSTVGRNQENSDSTNLQISAYVVDLFEDSKGTLWFGTLGDGVARFDGDSLRFLTTEDGLVSNEVCSILEDPSGNLWFGTQSGLSKYDGSSFTNYTDKDGLCDNRISYLLLDSKSTLWIGTWGGVCRFDGTHFTEFPISNPEVDGILNDFTKNWITEIMEDSNGNLWFTRDGYGACMYDGKTLRHFTKKDGLLSNNLQSIEESNDGTIWLGSRVAEKDNPDPNKRTGSGGLNRYSKGVFGAFPNVKGLSGNDVYAIYKDPSGNLWFSTIEHGVYKYDGEKFTNFLIRDSENTHSKAVQSFLEDRKGTIWFGCSGGLYRMVDGKISNVTRKDLGMTL